ncbi:MAG TPA: hypothetical protein VNO70_13055 [Blastocatellia bacterium]|nr:hypothetical protein [Blastocatellia bacterium]
MMSIEPQELISQLRDQDLLRIAYGHPAQYRPEAITYAKAELKCRGVSFDELVEINANDIREPLPVEAFGRTIRKEIRAKAFGIGFVIGLIPFVWMNVHSYHHMYRHICDDCFVFFGFPFYLYQTGGFAGPTVILWGGLIANAVIAACTSMCAGWILKRLLHRIGVRDSAA